MAAKKVLTDMNLLNIILSFTGVEIKRECMVCKKVIKYQILNQQIEYNHKSYINYELCKKLHFCNEDCLYTYKQRFNNERCCLVTNLICISNEPPTINVNLSV